MKMQTTFILLFSFLLGNVSLFAYEQGQVKTAYSYLSQNWNYYTRSGKKVNVKKLRWTCSGKNCKLIVNDKSINPATIYKLSGSSLVSVVNTSTTVKLDDKQVEKMDPAPSNAVGSEPGDLKGMTDAHNRYRQKTGVPNLVWDANLASYAQQWANYLKSTKNCGMQHRPRSGTYAQKYGENLAWSSGRHMSPYDVVKMWYDEISDYNYSNNSCRSVCGHYTQVVWKKSKRVGCALATCGRAEVWACNYYPPGNYIGEKPY